jgi:chromosome partitioning protein
LQVASLGASHQPLMMRISDGPGAFASLPRRSCIAEAQAAGEVLWKMKKTAARDARREIEPSPNRIAEILTAAAPAITTQEISHAAATR